MLRGYKYYMEKPGKNTTKIREKDDPILRQTAKEVPESDFGGEKLKRILEDMKSAVDKEEDGVAIAAPQIGISLRIFVVSEKVREILKLPDVSLIYINPIIVKASKDRKSVEEGCLSIRWLYGLVKRSSRVTIEAMDANGNKFSRGASGLLAQIFQHETDHLNGILFIDTAKEIRELPIAKKVTSNE